MERRRTVTFLATSIICLVLFSLTYANEDAQSTTGTTGQYTPPGANSVGAGGGNVTEVNISADLSTSKWQGYWGNVSGSLRLGDGTDTFYDWSDVPFTAVYASPNSAPDWGSLTAVSLAADKETKDTAYGFTSTDADSINSTMTGSGCAAGTEISGAAGVTPYNDIGGPGSWQTCIADTSGTGVTRAIFGTNVIMNGATAYNGANVQFQLMVPAATGGTDYYFFLEI